MGFMDNFAVAHKMSDFSITIHDGDWDAEWGSLVSRQTEKVEVNFVKRTLTFYLRQTKKGVIQDVIFHILTKETKKIDHILIVPAKGAKNSYQYHFRNGEVTDHGCIFAYESDKPLIHVLTVEFAEVELKTPAREQRQSTVIHDPRMPLVPPRTPPRQILLEGDEPGPETDVVQEVLSHDHQLQLQVEELTRKLDEMAAHQLSLAKHDHYMRSTMVAQQARIDELDSELQEERRKNKQLIKATTAGDDGT